MEEIKKGIYKHYKGKYYLVIGIGKHSETLEDFVIYMSLYDSEKFGNNALWIRPKKMFLEEINLNGKNIKRFEFVG